MSKKTLVVVEDEILVARDIKARLTRMGYEVLATASRGEEAVENVLRLRPDLVLMDINIKGEMDGVDAALNIRAQYDVPVIFCTAYSNTETLQRAQVAGPYGYVLKPFDNREMEINIEIALYKHAVEKDLADTRRHLDATLENVSDGVISADMQGRILMLNPVAEALTGWSQDEARASTLTEVLRLLPFSPEDAELDLVELSRSLSPDRRGRQRIRNKQGGVLPVEIAVSINRSLDADLMVITFRDISQQLDYEEEIRRSAFFDPLTGLPNRTLFMDHLEIALRRRSGSDQTLFAVMFIGLDNFSAITSGLGHEQGDQVLREIGQRIASTVGTKDTVSRFTGDKFALLLDPVDTAAEAIEVCRNIQAAIRPPLSVQGTTMDLTASIGLVLHHDGYHTTAEIIRDADNAIHRAKLEGAGSQVMFDSHMYETALTFLQLKSGMEQALLDGAFEIYYQPIVDAVTEKMVSMEALVRWWHPTRGIISPADFIPIAEKTGLIVLLGEFVLRAVCQQLRSWQLAGCQGFQVAVNLSARQFDGHLVALVRDVVRETGISPSALILEITEGVVMQDIERTIVILKELHAMGIGISIDDFGTGYSSLAYLNRLPLNTLKIDQSFIQNITTSADGREITRAIIALGHNLNLKVLAEGVETNEQLQWLKSSGCVYIQGYYYCRPLPAAQLLSELQRKNLLVGPAAQKITR